jgi:hypothetical protein
MTTRSTQDFNRVLVWYYDAVTIEKKIAHCGGAAENVQCLLGATPSKHHFAFFLQFSPS